MSATATLDRPTRSVPLKSWLAVAAVATATFAMVTVESLPVGLLTPIGDAFQVSEGTVALTVTLPGLLATLSAPLLPMAIGKLDRRIVLLGLISLMLTATAVAAFAPNFGVMLAARGAVGIAIGGFWALAASIAVRLVPAEQIPKATALAFGGASAANVLGAPLATVIGDWSNWQTAFLVLAGLGVVVAVLLGTLLPPLPATTAVRPRLLLAQWRNPAVRAALIATFLLVSVHWIAFALIRPVLQDITGLSAAAIGPALLAFGVAAVAGNFISGAASARDPRRALLISAALMVATLALFAAVGTTAVTGIAMLLLWGLAFGAIPIAVQTSILRAAPDAAEAATVLNTALFNLAIAGGALVGGLVFDGIGTVGLLLAAAATGALSVGAIVLANRRADASLANS